MLARVGIRKRRTALALSLAAGAILAVSAGLALAGPSGVPGPVTGLSSSSHPSETTWYDSANPSFTWDPVTANGAAIVGYSYVMDQTSGTIPDTSSERISLDYLARVTYTTGTSPTEAHVADFNGDGKLDLVTANNSANTISVLIGNGDGTFKAKADYATGAQPWSMDVGDLNSDGKPDVVVADHANGTNKASVLLNKGDGTGTFNAKVDYTTGTTPESLKLGDVNNDTYLDIVTANSGSNNVSVLRGRGDGTFRAKADFGTGGGPTSIDMGDLNGDGNLDLVAANDSTNNVSVLTGKGDATFNAKVDYATGARPFTVVVEDVNRDGKPDVQTVNYSPSTASVLINNGNGTLKAKVDYAVGTGPYSLAVKDLNSDGAPDLVTTNHTANTTSVLFGNGDGTFTVKTDRATGTGPFWVALGDFNGDGYGDLAITDQTASTISVNIGTAYLAASFTGKTDGVWYFHVRALDSYGDGGATSTRTVRIDTTAPVTTQSGADSAWHDSVVTVGLSATDAGSGVAGTEYNVDGAGWTSGTTLTVPAPPDGSNDGIHTVQYRSIDSLGHTETSGIAELKIVTGPATTTVDGADGAWHDSDVALTLDSSSPGDPVIEYRLDGGDWVQGTAVLIPAPADGSNDGEHTLEYRSTTALGHVETTGSTTVKIDAGAPTTSVTGADDAWHSSDVTLDFSGSDAGSGVAKVEYRIDGGDWVEGISATVPTPSNGSNDGTHAVEYRSTDAAGHRETAKSVSVKVDAGTPTTTAAGADAAWHDSDVTVSLTGSDSTSGVAKVEYRMDDGDWVEGTSVGVLAPPDGSNDGEHVVEYRSTDTAGNVEIPQSVTVKIVTVAPTTSAAGSDDAWHDADVTLHFSTTGAGVARTEYRIDGGDWVEGTDASVAAPADGSNDGEHVVEYRSTNALGVVETNRSATIKIDAGAPTTTASGADDAWHDSDVVLTFSSLDAGSGVAKVEYCVDGGDWVEGTSLTVPAPSDGSNDGEHTVEYRATDTAGHIEIAQCATVKVDLAPPTVVAPVDLSWHQPPYGFELAATDAGSGVETTYWHRTGDGSNTGTSVLLGGDRRVKSGRQMVTYWAVDRAGHVSEPQYATVLIDGQPPRTHDDSDGRPHTGDVTVNLRAYDGHSGVATTYISTDLGATWFEGSEVVVPAAGNTGVHTVWYYSVDSIGNAEPVRVTWVIIE
jgi:hypothetical protein